MVCVEGECVCFLYICYLEWLNELVCFVVNGSYEKLFIENPNLRDFMNKNQDDLIMNKLNNDQEYVLISIFSCLSLSFKGLLIYCVH